VKKIAPLYIRVIPRCTASESIGYLGGKNVPSSRRRTRSSSSSSSSAVRSRSGSRGVELVVDALVLASGVFSSLCLSSVLSYTRSASHLPTIYLLRRWGTYTLGAGSNTLGGLDNHRLGRSGDVQAVCNAVDIGGAAGLEAVGLSGSERRGRNRPGRGGRGRLGDGDSGEGGDDEGGGKLHVDLL
jgi:hypothetical protein